VVAGAVGGAHGLQGVAVGGRTGPEGKERRSGEGYAGEWAARVAPVEWWRSDGS
jgi:hypothetical protein